MQVRHHLRNFSNYFSNFLNQAPVNLTSNYDDGVLTITVNPTTNYIVNSHDVKLYDLEGTEAFSIPVSQNGDPNATLIGDNGNAYITAMAQAMYNSQAKTVCLRLSLSCRRESGFQARSCMRRD